MKRVYWERVLIVVCLALLWACVGFVVQSHAQAGGFVWSERSSSQPHGEYIEMWNATGTEILAGTVVMSDTTGLTVQPQIPLGKGFRTFSAGSDPRLTVPRIIGILMDNCPGFSKRRIQIYGWTNYVKMAATGYAGMTYLRPSLTVDGALASWAITDSTNAMKPIVGQFQRYESGTSLYGYAKIDFRSVAAGNR